MSTPTTILDSCRQQTNITRVPITCVYGAETGTYPGTGFRHCAGERDIEEVPGTVLFVALRIISIVAGPWYTLHRIIKPEVRPSCIQGKKNRIP